MMKTYTKLIYDWEWDRESQDNLPGRMTSSVSTIKRWVGAKERLSRGVKKVRVVGWGRLVTSSPRKPDDLSRTKRPVFSVVSDP